MRAVNLTIVGLGNMGRVMVQALNKKKNELPYLVIRAVDGRRENFQNLSSVKPYDRLTDDIVKDTDIMLLSSEPNELPNVLTSLESYRLRESAMLVSVVAGANLNRFSHVGTKSLIRAMPNFPTVIGKGVTVWMSTDQTSQEQIQTMKTIFRAFGREEKVNDENAIDVATAVSGTGPAYVLLMMESMTDAAIRLGMQPDLARELVEQTVIGTSHYAKTSKAHTAILRSEIVSPGGTTAAALHLAEKGRFRYVVSDMMWTALNKTRELGQPK